MAGENQQENSVSLDEIEKRMVDPHIIRRMVRGYFEGVHNPYPPIESNVVTISCVDSRILPARLLDQKRGQAYAIQTVANVVPKLDLELPYDDQSIEVAAALEYVVSHKGINEAFVLAHTHCGGAEARLIENAMLPNVNRWMSHVCIDGLHSHPPASLLAAMDENPFYRKAALRQVERECLHASIANIKSLPFILDAIEKTKLSLAGLICDMDAGELEITYGNNSALEAISDLIARFKRFKSDEWGPNGRMHDLVTNGQHPQALIITGISPYVAPENVFGIEPGDSFVHRRIGGNYHHEHTPGGLAATIEFAVVAKKIKSLIIVGHRNDVNRDYAEGLMDRYDLVRSFMEKATPELRQWRKSGMHPDRMHENSLKSTYFNTMAHPAVMEAMKNGELSVAALLVDHEQKNMEFYNPVMDKFVQVIPPSH